LQRNDRITIGRGEGVEEDGGTARIVLSSMLVARTACRVRSDDTVAIAHETIAVASMGDRHGSDWPMDVRAYDDVMDGADAAVGGRSSNCS
jgi:hypothetical protein